MNEIKTNLTAKYTGLQNTPQVEGSVDGHFNPV
jgi:hypothetical protein